MEAVAALMIKYRDEFETTVASLCQRSAALGIDALRRLQQLRRALEPQLRTKVAALCDLSPLPPTVHSGFILEAYMWTAVLLIALRVGQLFGALLIGPLLLGPLFNTGTLAGLTYVLLPVYFFVFNRKHAELTESDRRMLLLALALVLGATSGYLTSERVLPVTAPPPFVLPLVIAASAQVGLHPFTLPPLHNRQLQTLGTRLGRDRRLLLVTTMGASAGVYVLLGAVTGQLGVTYTLMVAIMISVSTVQLQLTTGDADMIVSQLSGLVLALYTQLVFLAVFGSSKYHYDGDDDVVPDPLRPL
uniref:Uncharacterized protein n=1 Tax=Plectus sambesii TaxID=2011161 RepID=A0A914WSX3_9BILA